jgi:hypothetical protein
MFDFMYKATDKTAWDTFISSLPEDITPQLLVDEIGPIEITPPVIDEDGEIVEEGVIDLSHHVNLRYLGDDDTVAASLSQGNSSVQWISPEIVASPNRIWAGGMNYWVPLA